MSLMMSRAIKQLFVPVEKLYCHSSMRYYSPRLVTSENSDDTLQRNPLRAKRRMAKAGITEEKAFAAQNQSEYHKPPVLSSDSARMPPGSHELKAFLEDLQQSKTAPLPSTEGSEMFPSDHQKFLHWYQDQSRKAYRPPVAPSTTSLILFPGQGSQFVGMGNDLLEYEQAKELFEEASAVLKYDLLKLCLQGPLTALNKTVHCQPAVLVTALAAVEKLAEQNPEAVKSCVGTVGFSIGEYAALVHAGVLSFSDAVNLVRVRAEAMQKASEEVPSGMMSVFLNHSSNLKTAMKAARDYCQQRCGIPDPVCTVANYLYPDCKVIAGHMQALDFVELHAKTFGLRRTKRLPVSGAFHTKLMESAQKPVKDALTKATINPPKIAVYSNVTASRFRKPSDIQKLLVKQIVEPVRWEQIMHVLYSRQQGEEFPNTYEVGSGSQLGVLLKLVNLKAYKQYNKVQV